MTLHQLNATVPHANQINPSFLPPYKLVIGLPVISSTRIFAENDQLSFNDIFTRQEGDDSLTVDEDRIISNLRDNNDLDIGGDVSLLYVGLNIRNNYFSLALNERAMSNFDYTKDLVTWALKGPADEAFENRGLDIKDLDIGALAFHEIALGWGRQLNERFNVGVRLKYLIGYLNVNTESLSGVINANLDTLSIFADQIIINSSGVKNFDSNVSEDFSDAFLSFSNSGFGIDLGAQFRPNDRLTFSASITDIGSISWNDFQRSYQLNSVTYTFTGFDLLDLIADTPNKDFLQNELDSIKDLFDPQEVDGISYSTTLPWNFYGGVEFEFVERQKIGALFYTTHKAGRLRPALSLSYNLRLRKVLNAVINGSIIDGEFTNLGLGFSADLGPVQVFATTNNIFSLAFPASASILSANFGLNLVFGKSQKEEFDEVTPTGEPARPKYSRKKVVKTKEKRIKQQYKKKKRKRYN